MRIAFDLDNTLIPYQTKFPLEKRSWYTRLLKTESLRQGTVGLFKQLKREGHEIWIYTSSFRPKRSIYRTFMAHGLTLDGIVNQQRHDRTPKAKQSGYSKYPPAFAIDLLIDDSPGVQIEGERGGFEVMLLMPEDENWVDTVLNFVHQLHLISG